MKRLNIAMLGEQAQAQEPVVIDENNEALVTDQDAMQIQQQGAEIDEVQSVVQETQDAADSIQQTADKIEQMPEVSQEVVQVAQEQIAYFMKRTGMKMTGVTTAMESYTVDKAGNKAALVKQLRVAAESLDKGAEIAQEGLVDRIKNRISLMFTSSEKLAKELVIVSKEYDAAGAKEEVIKDPAFARRLNQGKKGSLTESDVVSFVEEINKKYRDPRVIGSLKTVTESFNKIVQALYKSGTWIADEGAVDKIQEQQDVLMKLYDEVMPVLSVDRTKASADVEPLTPANKEKVVKLVESLVDVKEYNKYVEDLIEVIHRLTGKQFENAMLKVHGSFSKDTRNSKIAQTHASKVFDVLNNLSALRLEVAHACVKYIKASTAGKSAPKEQAQAPAKQSQA